MALRILTLVKRVPATGGRINLAPDGRSIDTAYLGFVVSPHEECAVEEAIRLVETHGGEVTVMTLGPAEAADQLRDALAVGAERAVHLETDGSDWDPVATSAALVAAIRDLESADGPFDLILVGNESADSGGFQVGIRVAVALERSCVNGAKQLEVTDGVARARRQIPGGWEVYDIPLPAVVGVKEGINLPRYPSVPGRLRARKKEIERVTPAPLAGGLEMIRLRLPVEQDRQVEVLGTGPEAAPRVVEILREVGAL
jgi:electron transfer flavoprotein beta subunit